MDSQHDFILPRIVKKLQVDATGFLEDPWSVRGAVVCNLLIQPALATIAMEKASVSVGRK